MSDEKKDGKKKEKKVVKGWNLSAANVMAVKAAAFERTLLRKDGKTTSASAVLDEIVTAWREGQAKKGRAK